VSFCTLSGIRPFRVSLLECMAGTTGLEPATSAVTEPPKSCKTARFVDRTVDQVSQPSYASSSVSALLSWQLLSQGPLVRKGYFSDTCSWVSIDRLAGYLVLIETWVMRARDEPEMSPRRRLYPALGASRH